MQTAKHPNCPTNSCHQRPHRYHSSCWGPSQQFLDLVVLVDGARSAVDVADCSHLAVVAADSILGAAAVAEHRRSLRGVGDPDDRSMTDHQQLEVVVEVQPLAGEAGLPQPVEEEAHLLA